ncbi:MAG: oxaloacetate decarboxylase, partial [Pseudomonas sp.]
LAKITENIKIPLMLVTYNNPNLRDDKAMAELGVRVVVDGHIAYFAAVKATYDSLRQQRGLPDTEKLNASALVTRYTQPADYKRWAREYLNMDS